MNYLSQFSKDFQKTDPEIKNDIVDAIYNKIIYDNPLEDICKKVDQKQTKTCPKCKNSHYYLNGKRKGIQSYRCKKCGRYFNEFSGSTIAYIKKKDLIRMYIFQMLNGRSILECSKIIKVSIQTSFDWRHKILAGLKDHIPNNYNGIVEMETYKINFSRKGQGSKAKKIGQKGKILDPSSDKKADSIENPIGYLPVSLVAVCDRNENFELKVIKQGELNNEDLKEHYNNKLKKVKKLCVDSNILLKQYAGKKKISYYFKDKGKKVKGCNKYYHTNNIQIKYIQLETFMERFFGVSSSYLQNYLYWYIIMYQVLNNIDKSSAFIEKSLSAIQGKEFYKKCKMFV